MKKRLLLTLAALWAGILAADGIELPINGDFRGRPGGHSPAPGWYLSADGGAARILPTRDRNEFCLELAATPTRPQSAISALQPLSGSVLKLEVKFNGRGTASMGYETFDEAQRVVVGSERQTVRLTPYDHKLKRYFTLRAPARYIRIRLTAEAGSLARFRDVEAELSGPVPAAAAPVTVAAPAPVPVAAPAPAPAPAPARAPIVAKPLVDDSFFAYEALGWDEHYAVTLPVRSDVDFDLAEDPGRRLHWQLVSYDPAVCRVKLKHDRSGAYPLYRYKAEIELKAVAPGRTDVVFACGRKRFTVHFTAQ